MAQKGFCSDLCTGTERGFKGLTILFFIYGFASLLACLIISQLTRSHLDYDQDNTADYDGDAIGPSGKSDNTIRSNCDTLNKILLSLGGVFWLGSAISAILRQQYKNVPGKSAQEVLAYRDLDKETSSAR